MVTTTKQCDFIFWLSLLLRLSLSLDI